MPKRRRPAPRAALDLDEVIAGRVKPTVDDLFDLIHHINPTGHDLATRESKLRYAQKARLQSLLIQRFPEQLLVLPDPAHEGMVALRHKDQERDACHAVIATLDDDARAWIRLQVDLGAHLSTQPQAKQEAARPRRNKAPAPKKDHDTSSETPEALLRRAEDALAAYDYERARQDLERALATSDYERGPAVALLELLVETLGDDAAALALKAKIPASTLADPKVRGLLALAAARSNDEDQALLLLRGVDEWAAAVVYAALAAGALKAGEMKRAERHLEQAKRRDPTSLTIPVIDGEIARARALLREPLEEEIGRLIVAGRDDEAERNAAEVLARWPESEAARRALRAIEERRRRAEVERLAAEAEVALARGETAEALSLFGRALLSAGRGPEREAIGRRVHAIEEAERERRASESVERACRLLDDDETDPRDGFVAYLELTEALRERVRARSPREELGVLDLIAEERATDHAKVEAVIGLGRVGMLAQSDPEAALAALEPHGALLGRVPLFRRIARDAALSRERRAAELRAEEARAEEARTLADKVSRRDRLDRASPSSKLFTQAARGMAWNIVAVIVYALVQSGIATWVTSELTRVEGFAISSAMLIARVCNSFALVAIPRYLVLDKDDRAAGWHALMLTVVIAIPLLGLLMLFSDSFVFLFSIPTTGARPYLLGLFICLTLEHLGAVTTWKLARELRFGAIGGLHIVGNIVNLLIACVCAALGMRGMSIVAGLIVGRAVQLIGSAALSNARTWLRPEKLSPGRSFSILRFALPLAGVDSLALYVRRWEAVCLASRIGLNLGNGYLDSSRLFNLGDGDVYLDAVLFPTLAAEETRKPQGARIALVHVLGLMALVYFPIAGWFWAASPVIDRVYLDHGWEGMISVAGVFALMAPLRILGLTIGAYLQVRRRTVTVLLLALLRYGLMIGATIMVLRGDWGQIGAAFVEKATRVSLGGYALVNLLVLTGTEGIPLSTLIRRLGPPLAAAAGMSLAVHTIAERLMNAPNRSVMDMVLLFVVGLGGYAVAVRFLCRAHGREFMDLLRRAFWKRRRRRGDRPAPLTE
jgi:O-antigen/teichoic acid export membrane protein/tetratricopeptide (TPR) repeat protein